MLNTNMYGVSLFRKYFIFVCIENGSIKVIKNKNFQS